MIVPVYSTRPKWCFEGPPVESHIAGGRDEPSGFTGCVVYRTVEGAVAGHMFNEKFSRLPSHEQKFILLGFHGVVVIEIDANWDSGTWLPDTIDDAEVEACGGRYLLNDSVFRVLE